MEMMLLHLDKVFLFLKRLFYLEYFKSYQILKVQIDKGTKSSQITISVKLRCVELVGGCARRHEQNLSVFCLLCKVALIFCWHQLLSS